MHSHQTKIFHLILLFFFSNNAAQILRGGKEENTFYHKRHRRSLPSIEEAKVIVDEHNRYRAIIGDEGEEPIPSNMRFMTWDDGLAMTSLAYAKYCDWNHSPLDARKTPQFSDYNGENLWAGDREHVRNFDPAFGIARWYNEYPDYTFSNNSCVPGRMCGHYTQVVWANTYKIGCAWTLCSTLTSKTKTLTDAIFMICHYAPAGNVKGEKPYIIGERCSKCASFDTCPDQTLCHNAKRDVVIPYRSNAAATAGILSGVVIILAIFIGVGYYVYNHKQSQISQMLATFRKTRRVSSAAVLNEPKSSCPNGNNDEDERSK